LITALLHLVDQKGQQQQTRQHRGQVLLPVPIVVFKVIALVFQRVLGLVFDPPACPAPARHRTDGVGPQGQVGYPRPLVAGLICLHFYRHQEVNLHVLVALIQTEPLDEQPGLLDASLSIDRGHHFDLLGLQTLVELRKQVLVVGAFDTEDEMTVGSLEVADVRGVGTEGVLGDDDRQPGMVLAKPLQPAAGRVALAVVLGLALLSLYGFGSQRHDFGEVRMQQDSAE